MEDSSKPRITKHHRGAHQHKAMTSLQVFQDSRNPQGNTQYTPNHLTEQPYARQQVQVSSDSTNLLKTKTQSRQKLLKEVISSLPKREHSVYVFHRFKNQSFGNFSLQSREE
jgi:hypothetical protein